MWQPAILCFRCTITLTMNPVRTAGAINSILIYTTIFITYRVRKFAWDFILKIIIRGALVWHICPRNFWPESSCLTQTAFGSIVELSSLRMHLSRIYCKPFSDTLTLFQGVHNIPAMIKCMGNAWDSNKNWQSCFACREDSEPWPRIQGQVRERLGWIMIFHKRFLQSIAVKLHAFRMWLTDIKESDWSVAAVWNSIDHAVENNWRWRWQCFVSCF